MTEMNQLSNVSSHHSDSPASHRSKMILLSLTTAVIITLFQWQLANFIYKDSQKFWQSGSPSYGTLAHAITEQNIFSLDKTTPTAYRPPLYPLFLAAHLFASEGSQPIFITQSLLAGSTLGLLTIVAYTHTQKSWPILVMIFLFATNKFIPIDNIVQHETILFTFLLCLGGHIFTSETQSHSVKKIVSLSIVLSLAALTRPLATAVLMIGGLWFGWLIFHKQPFVEISKRIALFTVIFLLILMPWGIRNWLSVDTFTLSTTTQGINLWKGNNPATKDIYPTLEIDEFTILLDETPTESGWWDSLRTLPTMSEAEQNDYLFNLGLQYIVERPFHFLKMGFVKLWSFWTPRNVPYASGDIQWTVDGAKISNLVPFFDDMIPTLMLYLLAIPGIWKHRRSPFVLYLLAWSVALSSLHFITFAESRFRWPVNMLMLPLAAVGFDLVSTRLLQIIRRLKHSQI